MKSIGDFRDLIQKKTAYNHLRAEPCGFTQKQHLIIERMKMFNTAILRQKIQMDAFLRLS